MIVDYSGQRIGPTTVPPHQQTCSASRHKKFGPKWRPLTRLSMCWTRRSKLQKKHCLALCHGSIWVILLKPSHERPPTVGWDAVRTVTSLGTSCASKSRESILAPIDVLGILDLKNIWWILVLNVWGEFWTAETTFEPKANAGLGHRTAHLTS